MALQPEAEKAIDDIVNEAIIIDDNKMPIDLNLDEIEELSDDIKELIRDEFEHCLKLLKMNTKGYDVFRNWYVDGKIFYHIVIDLKSPRLGIKELRFIDPRKIKKIKKPVRSRKTVEQTASTLGKEVLNKKFEEFYLYQSKGSNDSNSGIKIAPDAIAYCHSGVMDTRNYNILGHLHKAIKPLNQLRMLEDATVIYRLARAPERRIFYIDVGNLPKQKAEQYLRDMMVKHKNKLVYDANTGEVRDDRKFLTMLEDYWLPRREGGRGTEITTLPGGQNLGELDDVQYFRRKLYESLNVPVASAVAVPFIDIPISLPYFLYMMSNTFISPSGLPSIIFSTFFFNSGFVILLSYDCTIILAVCISMFIILPFLNFTLEACLSFTILRSVSSTPSFNIFDIAIKDMILSVRFCIRLCE